MAKIDVLHPPVAFPVVLVGGSHGQANQVRSASTNRVYYSCHCALLGGVVGMGYERSGRATNNLLTCRCAACMVRVHLASPGGEAVDVCESIAVGICEGRTSVNVTLIRALVRTKGDKSRVLLCRALLLRAIEGGFPLRGQARDIDERQPSFM